MSASYLQHCPEGWQVVPKTVTPEMAEAYASDAYDTAQQCHDAVLGAAPQHGDAWLRKCVATRDAQIDELVSERDAALEREATLAAHVERLRNACQKAFQTPLDEHYSKGVNVALHHAIESTGENNLARRDLIKQAEALEWMANEFDEQGEYRGYAQQIEDRAAELRQRAQEITE